MSLSWGFTINLGLVKIRVGSRPWIKIGKWKRSL